jgi:predicted phosphoribosyltransferase
MFQRFRDRTEAGELLGTALHHYADRDNVLILALPRGGVPVGFEVARKLHAPLDVLIVRKLGVPAQPELAMGAVASGGTLVINPQVVDALGIDESTIRRAADREHDEVSRRERLFRGDQPTPDVHGRVVIIVDDGLATGSTMRAAIASLRQRDPALVVVAVPTAPAKVIRMLVQVADRVVCLTTPEPFNAISQSYDDFEQVEDDAVRRLLEQVEAVHPRGDPHDAIRVSHSTDLGTMGVSHALANDRDEYSGKRTDGPHRER